MDMKTPLRFVPSAVTAAMITSAMRAASSPYSTALAPRLDSSLDQRYADCESSKSRLIIMIPGWKFGSANQKWFYTRKNLQEDYNRPSDFTS
jgi:hypothetical protein